MGSTSFVSLSVLNVQFYCLAIPTFAHCFALASVPCFPLYILIFCEVNECMAQEAPLSFLCFDRYSSTCYKNTYMTGSQSFMIINVNPWVNLNYKILKMLIISVNIRILCF